MKTYKPPHSPLIKNLTREEIEIWDKIMLQELGGQGGCVWHAAHRADEVIAERRARFKPKASEGPYR